MKRIFLLALCVSLFVPVIKGISSQTLKKQGEEELKRKQEICRQIEAMPSHQKAALIVGPALYCSLIFCGFGYLVGEDTKHSLITSLLGALAGGIGGGLYMNHQFNRINKKCKKWCSDC